jgi:hypothetical protein
MLYDDDRGLFKTKDYEKWKGAETWLHLIFNRALFIFGIGLEENEVFLRWLLIERAKYFSKFPSRRMKGWYVSKTGSTNPGKRMFLKKLSIEVIELPEYADIYERLWP